MAEDYTVQDGDCMSSIGYENGFYWKTLWNLSENAALKAKRKNPNVLMTGDVVHLPDLTVRQEPGATEATHKFMLKGVPEVLHLKLLDANHKPRANLDYVVVIEGKARRGKTDGKGGISLKIPPNARNGKLSYASVPDENGKTTSLSVALQLGNLDPISEVTGIQARLANLGFYKGAINGNLDDATMRAISAFQLKKGITVTGVADDATKAQLQKIHGH